MTWNLWDDFSCKTQYALVYCPDAIQRRSVGNVKILKRGHGVTSGLLPSEFTDLGEDFCSLGQNIRYYSVLKHLLGPDYRNFLYGMRDAAYFSKICDDFCDDPTFTTSLIRYDEAAEALKFAQYELAGVNRNASTEFVFKANIPADTDTPLSIRFNFGKLNLEGNINRIVALIGDNGSGKSTTLSQLAESIVKNDQSRFEPNVPLFSKVISSSYSIFDRFFKIDGSSYNYVYCGIQKKDGGLMSEAEITARREKSVKLINRTNVGGVAQIDRKHLLHRYLKRLFSEEVIDQLFDEFEIFQEEAYQRLSKTFSSGQSMLMNLTIEILAHIRNNTLLLIDEPEVHLHPKGISEILRIVDSLCERFNSCCVMATHSALVVQELLSKNVIILGREVDGSPVVRSMNVESMGENLTTITEDIFGRSSIRPLYIEKIREVASRSETLEAAIREVQNNEVPISMPLYLMLAKHFEKDA